jgi:hypothetical protein
MPPPSMGPPDGGSSELFTPSEQSSGLQRQVRF